MSIIGSPLFVGVATPILVALFAAIGVIIKRQFHRITKWLKRVWQMARGNGISLREHDAAIDDLKTYVKELVEERTYPIQPDSNGGESMPDLFILINGIKDRMEHRFDSIEKRAQAIGDTTSRTEGSLNTHINQKNAHS